MRPKEPALLSKVTELWALEDELQMVAPAAGVGGDRGGTSMIGAARCTSPPLWRTFARAREKGMEEPRQLDLD